MLTEETDTHKKGQAGETESTEEQEPDDSGEDKHGVGALLFSILSGLAFLLFLLLFFLCYGKKKICGTVCKTDGTPAANQRIILERIDGQEWENALDENETKTACTDRDGYFCFAGLPKGIYRVAFPAMQGRGAFTVTVCMTEDREDIFTVPLSLDGVETEKKGRTYTVNVGK